MQFDLAEAAIHPLVLDCRRSFLLAARLVGARSDAITKLSALGIVQSFDLSALQPVWRSVCQRYMAEQFNAQLTLLELHEPGVQRNWNELVYGEVIPAMVGEDEVVRNVLRSIGALPSESPKDAVTAIRHFVKEMDMPSSPPIWSPEKDIE